MESGNLDSIQGVKKGIDKKTLILTYSSIYFTVLYYFFLDSVDL